MKKLLLMLFVSAISVSLLVGCGGGGGGAPPPPVVTTAAAGLWTGTVTDSANVTNDFVGVASTNGQLRFIVDSGQCAGTQYKGTFSMNGNTGSGSITGYAIGGCIFSNGTTISSGTINFTISGTSLTGTALSGGDSGTFNLTYDPIANSSITLADLEGNWGYNFGGGEFITITVASDGSISGVGGSGCNFSGQINIIDPDWSITNISVTTSSCGDAILNGTYSGLGLLVFDAGGDLFYLMVSKSNLSYFDILGRLP